MPKPFHSLEGSSQENLTLTIGEALNQAEAGLAKALESPRLEAELLLAALLDCPRTTLLAHPERMLSAQQVRRFENWLELRRLDYPLQYLSGGEEFFGRRFSVSAEVLIPRPETEGLVESALRLLSPISRPIRVVDVGTGSGCIAVTLCCENPLVSCLATDIHFPSLRMARRNALAWNCLQRLDLICADGLDFLHKGRPFDLIVSNPPYITEEERQRLQSGVRDFEPGRALFGGEDGLDVYRKLFQQARGLLEREGHLLLEIGSQLEGPVRDLAEGSGWRTEEVEKDLAGHPRVASFRRP